MSNSARRQADNSGKSGNLACEQVPGEDEKISASVKQKNSESKVIEVGTWEPEFFSVPAGSPFAG